MSKFHIQSMQIRNVQKSAALHESEKNAPIKWKASQKENQGFGEINGEEVQIKDIWNLTNDKDRLDQN